MAKQIPAVGTWYQDAEEDVLFEVVAVDEESTTIEVQFESGEVGEFDFETWKQMVVLRAQPPEDWRSSYELSDEDNLDADDVYIPDSWDDPLSAIESDNLNSGDDYY